MDYVKEPQVLVNAIFTEIEKAKLDYEKSTAWTVAVKRAIHNLIQCEVTDVIFTRPEENVSEFMLDIVAWNREDGEGIVLAVECEWLLAPSEIVKDFEKLLVTKSATKLMIFASSGIKSQRRIKEALEKSFRSYKHHVVGERYIFMDFAKHPNRAAYWFEVNKNGCLTSLPEIHRI